MLFDRTGCRPRVACVEFRRRSDSVLQYRIGRHLTWPLLTDTPSPDDVCADELFTERNVAKHYTTIVNGDRQQQAASFVACGVDAWYHFNGTDSSGRQFEGYIDACGQDVTTFRYVVSRNG